jgi:hypothetical protein
MSDGFDMVMWSVKPIWHSTYHSKMLSQSREVASLAWNYNIHINTDVHVEKKAPVASHPVM